MQEPLVFEPLDVGQIPQARQSEDLEESLRRDISNRRAGLGRAQSAVDETVALQRADDVAAYLLAGEARDLRARRRLQIGDRRDRQELGRRQLGEAGSLPPGVPEDFYGRVAWVAKEVA